MISWKFRDTCRISPMVFFYNDSKATHVSSVYNGMREA